MSKAIGLEQKDKFQKRLESIINNESDHYQNRGIEKEYMIEINKLSSRINELEIEKARLSFENKTLQIRLEQIASDTNDELEMNKEFYEKTLTSYQKTIANLHKQIMENSEKESIKLKQFSNEFTSKQSITNQDLIMQLNEISSKVKAYDSENYILNKKAQYYQEEIAEYKIYSANKDRIIAKLQKDIEDLVIEYKKKIECAESNVEMRNKEIEELRQKNDELTRKLTDLTAQNNELQIGFEEMANNLQETNDIVQNKIIVFENDLNRETEKNKLYKEKIIQLKRKINQLYDNIESNKEPIHQGNQQEQRMNQDNNTLKNNSEHVNIASTIQIDDPYENSQRKSIEDYKEVLKKIDLNLFNYDKIIAN